MFNKVKKKYDHTKVKNAEGYVVYKMKDDQALFMTAISFVPRSSFYNSVKKQLENFEQLIDRMITSEPKFVIALAWYIGKIMGIRLSPVLMAARLAEKGHNIKRIISDVFTRPDFIANFLSYWKNRVNGLQALPKEVFTSLKRQFESYNELTLKRRKMLSREFKLKDLIKILKPHPKDSKTSLLYRAIIEDSKGSKLETKVNKETGAIESSEHTTAAISDDRVSHSAKQEFVQKSIKDLPINSLIKNLSFLTAASAPELKSRLTSLFKSGNGLRFINPFDLIFLESVDHRGYNQGVRVDPEIVNVCDEVLKEFVTFECNARKPVILYDRSGSMKDERDGGSAHRVGSKFLSMLNGLFLRDFRFYTFSARHSWGCYGRQENSHLPAAILDVTAKFKEESVLGLGPNALAKRIQDKIQCEGGTELLEAMQWTIKNNPEMDLFVVITDEMTWAEPHLIEAYRRMIPEYLAGKVLLINVAPSQTSVFKPTAKIIRISGLDGKIIKLIEAVTDFSGFKKRLIEQYEAE